MTSVFHPPAISVAEVRRANRLVGTRRALSFSFLGLTYAFAFQAGAPQASPVCAASARVGNRAFWLGIEDLFFRDEVRAKAAGADIEELPAPVATAVLESLLDDLLNLLDAWAGGESRVTQIFFAPDIRIPDDPLAFSLSSGSGHPPVSGLLSAAAGDMEWLAGLLEKSPPITSGFSDLPFAVAFELGETDLSLADLKGLDILDIVLMDRAALSAGNRVRVRVGGGWCFSGTINDNLVRVEDSMAEETGEQMAQGGAKKAGSLKELYVKLVFEVGGLTMTMDGLSAIRPGYTFELDSPTERPVTIRANGKVIGTGEILDVEGRIGVRILELFEYAGH